MPLAAGDRLGPYELVSAAGTWSMGEIWKARDTRMERAVALKISQTQFPEPFVSNLRSVSELNHPHICKLYDIGPHYLASEWIEGAPLRGPLPQAEALRFAFEIADALEYAHKRGIPHGDLNSSKILVTHLGVQVLDWGTPPSQAAAAAPDDEEE